MSSFKVPVIRISKIHTHNNADTLELAQIEGYKSVVLKGQYKEGDIIVYIPEQSILPEDIIEILGLKGRLAGRDENRVKIIKLRGEVSQGIILSLDKAKTIAMNNGKVWNLTEGDDASEILNITKYNPPIPTHLAGDICNFYEARFNYDIENYQRYPNVLQENEPVQITEKIHGTFCGIGYLPNISHPDVFAQGHGVVFSKGLGSQGLVFYNNENNNRNLYVQTALSLGIFNKLKKVVEQEIFGPNNEPLYIFGEIFGNGVQDLSYGVHQHDNKKFRIFDAYVGSYGQGKYLNYDSKIQLAEILDIDTAPVLYTGPFTYDIAEKLRDGKETISGQETHIREGVVITPLINRYESSLGRVILKLISPDYALRKNATEYV